MINRKVRNIFLSVAIISVLELTAAGVLVSLPKKQEGTYYRAVADPVDKIYENR